MFFGLFTGMRLRYGKGVLTPTLQPVRDWFATKKTEIAERLQRSRKGFLKVANQLPIEISRELSFELHKRLAATEFDRKKVA